MGVEVIKSWPTGQSRDVVWPTCLTFSIIYFSSDVSYHLMFELKFLASDEEKHDIRYIIICKLIFNFNIFIIRVIPSVVWVEMTFLRQRETWHSLYILSINKSFSFYFCRDCWGFSTKFTVWLSLKTFPLQQKNGVIRIITPCQ